jgi:hypothetical protein
VCCEQTKALADSTVVATQYDELLGSGHQAVPVKVYDDELFGSGHQAVPVKVYDDELFGSGHDNWNLWLVCVRSGSPNASQPRAARLLGQCGLASSWDTASASGPVSHHMQHTVLPERRARSGQRLARGTRDPLTRQRRPSHKHTDKRERRVRWGLQRASAMITRRSAFEKAADKRDAIMEPRVHKVQVGLAAAWAHSYSYHTLRLRLSCYNLHACDKRDLEERTVEQARRLHDIIES